MVERAYVPALGFHFLTRFYDPLVTLTPHVLDFEAQGHGLHAFLGGALARLHGHAHTEPPEGEDVAALAREAGFARVERTGRIRTPFGGAAYWRAEP